MRIFFYGPDKLTGDGKPEFRSSKCLPFTYSKKFDIFSNEFVLICGFHCSARWYFRIGKSGINFLRKIIFVSARDWFISAESFSTIYMIILFRMFGNIYFCIILSKYVCFAHKHFARLQSRANIPFCDKRERNNFDFLSLLYVCEI